MKTQESMAMSPADVRKADVRKQRELEKQRGSRPVIGRGLLGFPIV